MSEKSPRSDRVDVTCPCCRTRLVVDTENGEILAQERPEQDVEKTFDAAMKQVHDGAGRREDAFKKALDRNRRLDDVLEKKFEEARKKAEQDPDKRPFNPLDAD